MYKLRAKVPLGEHQISAMIPEPINAFQTWITGMFLHKTNYNGEVWYFISSGSDPNDELVLFTEDELSELSQEFLEYFDVIEQKQKEWRMEYV